MTEWEESTAKGSIAAPAAGQDGMAMPPWGPSGSGHGRRSGLIIGLVVVLIALAGGAYLFVRSRDHKQAPVNQVAAVRRAYLLWWNARVREYLTLNSAPVKPYMTAEGYNKEQSLLAEFGSNPFQLVATHNLQVFVYADGTDASVDDVWLSNSTYLDPTTHQPVGTRSNLTAEDSTSLKKVAGHWLVDDVVRIGASQAGSDQQISYAAADGGVSPPRPEMSQIEAAFEHYENVRDAAYLTLNSTRLAQVEAGEALSADVNSIGAQAAINQAIKYVDQDSYRVAFQNATTAWIYDTVGDQTVGINPQTKAPVQHVAFAVYRSIYELVKGPGGWMIEDFEVISQS